MVIHRTTSSVDFNQWWKPFDQILKLTNQPTNPKLLSQTIKKLYYKTLGTTVINSPISPPYLSIKKYRRTDPNYDIASLLISTPLQGTIHTWDHDLLSSHLGIIQHQRIYIPKLLVHTLNIKYQRSKGIRQQPLNSSTLYIPNDDTQIYPFCRLKFVVKVFDR